MSEIDELCGKKGAATSLLDCADTAKHLQLETVAFRWTRIPKNFKLRDTPAILPVVLKNGYSHFAAAVDSRPNQFLMIDFPYPPTWVDCDVLRRDWHWNGTMLHVAEDGTALVQLRTVAGGRASPLLMAIGVAVLMAGMMMIFLRRRIRTTTKTVE